jgi:hypothetical protein
MRPTGKEFDHAHDTPVRWPPEYQSGGNLDRIISDPEPGVWQVIVENQNLTAPGPSDSESRRARFQITARIFGAECKVSEPEFNTRVREVANKQQVRFANYFASVDGYYAETSLGSAFTTRETISEASPPIVYEINVPQGANALMATVNGPVTKDADVDLYLYLCANGCELKAFSARNGITEKVVVIQPAAGKWKVVIDPVSVPSGTLTVDYTDVFTHPVFGSLVPLSRNATYATGVNGDTEVLASISAVPVGNRHLVGLVQLKTREPATVRYEYKAGTKTVEPVKEQVVVAEALLDLHNRVNKPKSLTGTAFR